MFCIILCLDVYMCYINLLCGKILLKVNILEGDIASEHAGFNIYMYTCTFFVNTTCLICREHFHGATCTLW